MANNPVATLTSKGWVADPESKADALLSYIFTSDYSQSNIFRGKITSVQYMIQQWGNSPAHLRNDMAKAIQSYLESNFDAAAVTITVIDPTSADDARLTVRLDAVVTQNGLTYSLGRLVSFLNSKVVSIMNLNNGTQTALQT